MSALNESQKLQNLLRQEVKKIIDEETKECLRTKKATVTSAPNGSTCSVRLVGDSTILTLPYSSKVSSVSVGDVVWVAYLYNDYRNAIVWETHDFR